MFGGIKGHSLPCMPSPLPLFLLPISFLPPPLNSGSKFSQVLEITFLDQTNENTTEPELLYRMFIAVPFVIISSWKQPRSILTVYHMLTFAA